MTKNKDNPVLSLEYLLKALREDEKIGPISRGYLAKLVKKEIERVQHSVETNKEQPNYLECINPTATLKKGKMYKVVPVRKAYLFGRNMYVEHGVTKYNFSQLRVYLGFDRVIRVKPERFDTSTLRFKG